MAAIKSDKGYVHSLKWYSAFMREARRMRQEECPANVDPLLHKVSIEAMESQADTIGEQLDEYEKEAENGSIKSEIIEAIRPPENQAGSVGGNPNSEKTG